MTKPTGPTREEMAATEPEQPRRNGGNGTPWKYETLLKAFGAGSAILYGSLFLAYRAYYNAIGLSPEELGVNNTYVLVRAVGFSLVMSIVAGLYIIGSAAGERAQDSSGLTAFTWLMFFFASSFVAGFLIAAFEPPSWPTWIGPALAALGLLPPAYFGITHKRNSLAFATLTALVAVVFPSAAVIGHAESLGGRAADGKKVHPYTLAGLPLLDVSAVPGSITWLGPPSQRPVEIFAQQNQLNGMIIGQGPTVVVLVVDQGDGRRILRLPSGLVSVASGAN